MLVHQRSISLLADLELPEMAIEPAIAAWMMSCGTLSVLEVET
jgi:hypothetical protein